MCKFFGVSRAAYYAWVRALDQPDPDGVRMGWVQEAYEKSHRTYGYRRVGVWLRRKKSVKHEHKGAVRLMYQVPIAPLAPNAELIYSNVQHQHVDHPSTTPEP